MTDPVKLTWTKDAGLGGLGGFRCNERPYRIERTAGRRFVLYGCKEGEPPQLLRRASLQLCQGYAQRLTDEETRVTLKGSYRPEKHPNRLKITWEGDEGWDAESEGKP